MPVGVPSLEGNSEPMSPRFAAPSRASIRACATTSPSEWPARPSPSSSTPPSTSGVSEENAWASTPIPIRRSDTEELRHLDQRRRAQGFRGRLVEIPPRAAAQMDGDHAGRERRHDVVVDAVADICDLARLGAGLHDDPLEESGSGLLDSPPDGRADEVDVLPLDLLELARRVPDHPDPKAAGAQPREAGKGVAIEILRLEHRGRPLDPEHLPDAAVVLAATDQPAERPHQRKARDSGGIGGALPDAGLVHERLAGVEDDRLQSIHADTISRSTGSVTLSSFGSPSTTRTRPRAASTSDAQSVAPAMSPPSAVRSTEASNA